MTLRTLPLTPFVCIGRDDPRFPPCGRAYETPPFRVHDPANGTCECGGVLLRVEVAQPERETAMAGERSAS